MTSTRLEAADHHPMRSPAILPEAFKTSLAKKGRFTDRKGETLQQIPVGGGPHDLTGTSMNDDRVLASPASAWKAPLKRRLLGQPRSDLLLEATSNVALLLVTNREAFAIHRKLYSRCLSRLGSL